jgi:hypothetical protein
VALVVREEQHREALSLLEGKNQLAGNQLGESWQNKHHDLTFLNLRPLT